MPTPGPRRKESTSFRQADPLPIEVERDPLRTTGGRPQGRTHGR